MLRAKGLQLLPNFLSEIPEGALLQALNTVIDRDGIIQPRRGFKQWRNIASASGRANQILSYRNRILAQYGSVLSYDNGTDTLAVFKNADGVSDASCSPTETGRRIKGAEVNGNFYVTTSEGVKKISSSSSAFSNTTGENKLLASGVPQALDPVLNTNYASTGFMLPLSKVAYRIVLGYNDNNDNLLLGSPSNRVVVTNVSSSTCNVDLRVMLPENLTTDFFVQVYRSNNPFASSLDLLATTVVPNDEMQQVAERTLTQADLDLGYVDLTDTTTAEVWEVSTFLYTNEFSGEGLNQSNNTPPFAKDLTEFNGSLFAANTRTKHSIDINVLSVEGFEGLDVNSFTNSGQTYTLSLSGSHNLQVGDTCYVAFPDSTLERTSVPVDATNNTLDDATLHAYEGFKLRFTGSLPGGVSANTYYRIKRFDSGTLIQVLNDLGEVVDITSGTSADVEIHGGVVGEFEAESLSTGSTLVVTLPAGQTITSEDGAKVITSHLALQRESLLGYLKYYIGGSTGKFSVKITDSTLDTMSSFEDKVFYLNSFDNLRRYYFYTSDNDVAPPLSSITFPDTLQRIPVNLVQESVDITVSSVSGTVATTATAHNLATGDLIALGTLGVTGAVTGDQLFVLKLTDTTFSLSTTFNGSALSLTGAGTLFKKSNKAQVTSHLAEALSDYGDWKNLSTYELSFDPDDLDILNDSILITSHGLSTGDQVYITSSGTAPVTTVLMPSSGYYVNVLNANEIELYRDVGLTTLVDFTSAGTGTHTLHSNRVTAENATSGWWGLPSSATNQDIEVDTSSTGAFSVSLINMGFGEVLVKDKLLVKRSDYLVVSEKIDETARSLIKVVNTDTNNTFVKLFYTSGTQDFTPRISFVANTLEDSEIFLAFRDTIGTAGRDDFDPTLPEVLAGNCSSGTTITITTDTAHGLVVGDEVGLELPTQSGVYEVLTAPTTTTFTVEVPSNETSGRVLWYKANTFSTASVNPNRLYFSKYQQPEAFPTLNYLDVGAKNQAIERILALRDSLLIFKQDGIYRVTGPQAPNFTLYALDLTNFILAPDSAVVLSNLVYMFSNQGIVAVSDSGVQVISRAIENKLFPLLNNPDFKFISFGIAYETDRAYIIYVPSNATDTGATQCFRYNLFTQSWTSWNKPAKSGSVLLSSNRLYLGVDDLAVVEEERKSFDRSDYADREFNTEFNTNFYIYADKQILLPSVLGIKVGDSLFQTQYVTLAEIKNLTLKLSLDTAIPSGSVPFYANFSVLAGSNLTNLMSSLVTQLNTDLGTAFVAPSDPDPAVFQTQYNSFIQALNLSLVPSFSDYKFSTGTKPYETNITAINLSTKIVTIDDTPPFVVGQALHIQGIESDLIYAPISLGDPSIMKQMRETTSLFENTTFKTASMGYATDLDAAYEFVTFNMQGAGSWGASNWGQGIYGGSGPSYPFRTYLPREKQRARYWFIRFKHVMARHTYSLLGVSVIPSSTTERAYRG